MYHKKQMQSKQKPFAFFKSKGYEIYPIGLFLFQQIPDVIGYISMTSF